MPPTHPPQTNPVPRANAPRPRRHAGVLFESVLRMALIVTELRKLCAVIACGKFGFYDCAIAPAELTDLGAWAKQRVQTWEGPGFACAGAPEPQAHPRVHRVLDIQPSSCAAPTQTRRT
jgi:hypothetical protein